MLGMLDSSLELKRELPSAFLIAVLIWLP